jgi:hypothetical protein
MHFLQICAINMHIAIWVQWIGFMLVVGGHRGRREVLPVTPGVGRTVRKY